MLKLDAQHGDRRSVMLITIEQLATWLQVSKRSVYRLRAAGRLPAPVRFCGSARWRVNDIEAWVAAGCPACTTETEI